MTTHPFLIGDTCYWHHEWEGCGVCGQADKPDEPELPQHTHHDEAVEIARQKAHRAHPAHVAMREGRPVEFVVGVGWVVK